MTADAMSPAELRLALLANGYEPLPADGKAVYLPGWQKIEVTADLIKDWDRRTSWTNTGIRTGAVAAIDVDVLDEALADEVEALAFEMLGPTPCVRNGRAPKRLLVYRSNSPMKKIKAIRDDDTKVELLGQGQQFIAYGVHPDTAKPYTWRGLSLLDVAFADLPETNPRALHDFLAKAAKLIGVPEPSRQLERTAIQHSVGEDIEDIAIITDAMNSIPNVDTSYDQWIRIGHALKQALGEDGWPLFEAWSSRYPADDPEETLTKWGQLHPSGEIGAATIFWTAEQFGWKGERPDYGKRVVEKFLAVFREKNPALLAEWREAIAQHEAQSGTGNFILQAYRHVNGDGTYWRQLHPRHDVRVEHFHAYQPKDNFIFTPNGEFWVARTVVKFLGDMGAFHPDGSPVMIKQATTDKETGEIVEHEEQDTMPCHIWLEKFRPVQAFSWVPGEPEIIRDRLAVEAGWVDHPGANVFNQYHAPTIVPGDPAKAELWVRFGRELLLPQDAERFFDCMAFKRRYPGIKINRIIDLLGQPRIGKDALLQPVRVVVGTPNYSVINPGQLVGRFIGFRKSVILQVSEQHAPGNAFAKVDKYDFYEHTKDYGAAPPDMLRVDEKNRGEYYVNNCLLLVVTSNNPLSAFYLPAEDGRHDVMLSPQPRGWKPQSFFNELFAFYENGGCNHIAAWLDQRDLSAFNPKAPPPHTEAFYGIVNATRPPEAARLDDVLDSLGRPGAVTLEMIRHCEPGDDHDFTHWLIDRKFRGQIPHRFDDCGYTVVLSSRADKLWVVDSKRQAIYGRKDVPDVQRREAAEKLEKEGLEAALKRIDEELAKAADAAAAKNEPPPPTSWRQRKPKHAFPGVR